MKIVVSVNNNSVEARRIPTDASSTIHDLSINDEVKYTATHLVVGWFYIIELSAWIYNADCYVEEIVDPYDPNVDGDFDFNSGDHDWYEKYDPMGVLEAIKRSKVPASIVWYQKGGETKYLNTLIKLVYKNEDEIERLRDLLHSIPALPALPNKPGEGLVAVTDRRGKLVWRKLSYGDIENAPDNSSLVLYNQF